jgi:hypothetical protein
MYVPKGQNISVCDILICQESPRTFERILPIMRSQQPAILSQPGRDQSSPHYSTHGLPYIFANVIYDFFFFLFGRKYSFEQANLLIDPLIINIVYLVLKCQFNTFIFQLTVECTLCCYLQTVIQI